MNGFNYSLSELENMIPWERQVYVTLLLDYLRDKNEKLKMIAQTRKNMKKM